MFSSVNSAVVNGLNAIPVAVEINATFSQKEAGLEPLFFMVGLPDNAVKESRKRVQSALLNSKFTLPPLNVTANFAPADLRKEGSGLDLPLAVAILQTVGLIRNSEMDRKFFVGELGLDGTIKPVRGILPIAIGAPRLSCTELYVPAANAREAAVVEGVTVVGVNTLRELVEILNGQVSAVPTQVETVQLFAQADEQTGLDFADVKGQDAAKRAFEVAAAGGHNLILIGSPGCGKSMMAKRMPSILPPLTLSEALETTQIYSIAGQLDATAPLLTRRPFRAPHHRSSDVALIGGGTHLRPGEISLAHNGVLFLDEFPEFSRTALETLRQPLEERSVTIARSKYAETLPCSFMLIAAMNPCPCGFYNDPTHLCACTPGQIHKYLSKVSGPLLDRIDLQVELFPVPIEVIQSAPRGESSAQIRERVIRARQIQNQRFAHAKGVHCNAQMTEQMIHTFAEPDAQGMQLLRAAFDRLHLSARAYNRILKVARTIADLDGATHVTAPHVAEAIGYRNLDRSDWAERGL
ncbi:MAG: YifB family Mg chelatase-like AAA ATPase [Alloprevotella sp.]|nr:YifB family Mg chelatase-like AAA ATPase [Alloprevotella sp.]